jgi:hypothetical protein
MHSNVVTITLSEESRLGPAFVDQATRSLVREISDATNAVISVPAIRSPEGARSGILTSIGTVVVSGLTSGSIKAFAELLIMWLKSRDPKQQIRLTVDTGGGVKIEITRQISESHDLAAIVRQLETAIAPHRNGGAEVYE